MKKRMKEFYLSVGLLIGFILWTIAVCFFDVQPIGPQGSSVGFAGMNQYFHNLLGVHFVLYMITDWLGLVPLCVCMGFGILGLRQWIVKKKFMEVDRDLLALGGFYIATMAVYVLFEIFVVNYRPVLLEGILEPSFPSSTTMLTLCVMPTAIMQFNARIKNDVLKQCVASAITAFIVFMVIGSLISGVHWFTDIIGGALLSTGLVLMYRAVISLEGK